MARELAYSSDFESARQLFRRRAIQQGATLESLPVSARGPREESLSIDTAWLGPAAARSVLLHVSGVHGVEGFAGSALQSVLLEEWSALPGDVAVLMVHCVNPFGMAWLRRVNESNVDINRNCLAEGETYSGAPPDYARLTHLLNPGSPPVRLDGYYARALFEVLRCGKSRIAQAIAGGQYEYPQGLFYGGRQLEEGPRRLLQWLEQRLSGVERLFLLDVHTGLGRFGDDLLLVGHDRGSAAWKALHPVFGSRLRGPVGAAYRVRGGFFDAVERHAAAPHCWSVVHEFGTYSSLQVLAALRAENRLWWHGSQPSLEHPIRQRMRECFAPRSSRWRTRLLCRGRRVFHEALEITRGKEIR